LGSGEGVKCKVTQPTLFNPAASTWAFNSLLTLKGERIDADLRDLGNGETADFSVSICAYSTMPAFSNGYWGLGTRHAAPVCIIQWDYPLYITTAPLSPVPHCDHPEVYVVLRNSWAAPVCAYLLDVTDLSGHRTVRAVSSATPTANNSQSLFRLLWRSLRAGARCGGVVLGPDQTFGSRLISSTSKMTSCPTRTSSFSGTATRHRV